MRWSTVGNVTQAGAYRPGTAGGSGESEFRQRPRAKVGPFIVFTLIFQIMLARVSQLVKFISGSAGDCGDRKAAVESEWSFS